VVVGHLSHLLPVDRAIVLRCHPRELLRRLANRSVPLAWRRENVESEAIDLILSETRARVSRVDEVDTTRRTPRGSAQEIVRCLESTRPRPRPKIDWLADPWVTEYLLPSDP
jgi:adenylate kinase